MKICLKPNEFNPSLLSQSWCDEEKAKSMGYTIIEIDDKYIDCSFEDFDGYVFNVDKYNARKLQEENAIKILKLTEKLEQTDYIANKLAEAETEEEKQTLRKKYAEQLNNRKWWRAQINSLEIQQKQLTNQ